MRHHHGRHTGGFLNGPELLADGRPRPGVKRRQGLVEQQQTRSRRQSSSNRHALLLTAGKLGRVPIGQIREIRQLQHFSQARALFRICHFSCSQSVENVFLDGEIGKKRVILKNNADAACFHRRIRHIFTIDQYTTGSGRFQPGNEHQGRALAAARRPQDGRKASRRNLERCFMQSRLLAVPLGDGSKLQAGGLAFGHPCLILFFSASPLYPLPHGQNPSARIVRQCVFPLRC